MNKFNQQLTAVLAVQFLIAGGIFINNQNITADQLEATLLSTEKNLVDSITINEGDNKLALINKRDGVWQLPDYHQLPANQNKVDDLLEKLSTTKSGWPVTTTDSSHERLKVSDQSYQKKVVLSGGNNELQTLYLGTSPGFRQLHVRNAQENEVYAAKLNNHDFSVDASNWLDKKLLQPKGTITSVKGPDFALEKNGENWELTEGKGETIKEEVNKLANRLAQLTVQSAEQNSSVTADYQLTIRTQGDPLIYKFYKEGDKHFASRNDYKQVFKISKTDYEDVVGKTYMQLVKISNDETSGSPTKSSDADIGGNRTLSNTKKEVMPKENS